MALLRHLCFPSTTSFLTAQPLQKPLHSILSFSSSFSPLSHALPLRTTGRINLFHISASAQTQSPPPASPSTAVTVDTPQNDEEEEFSRTRLIAQNIPWTCTAQDIRSLFEKYGTVLDVELSMHNKTRNRGLAFISMGSPEEALAALSNLESYEFEGRAIKVNYANPQKKKPSSPVQRKPVTPYNLFIANLPYQARAKDLREFFSSGNCNVVSAEVIFHENPRRSSGYGFVSFGSKEEADTALSSFQGQMFMGRPLRVARSRRFVKRENKMSDQTEDVANPLNSNSEQSGEGDDI